MREIMLNGRNMVRFFCALAIVLLAFAHKPVDPGYGNRIDLAAYTLPDGTVPVICQPSGGDRDGHDHHDDFYGKSCEACRISSAFACPVPPKTTGPALHRGEMIVFAPAAPVVWRDAYPPSAPPHAPPFV
ncbi:hypothetical protein ATN84_04105 [Paramesorhizobium deserti]|uniref:DUF2946 domain-containing protein n=1 Tax=Paramesorhizobium deserti TaxID=1494590 RepID=A0A135I0H1_9HYPH|nr:hypothetical protein [Paramesorhizobium deserti]KXF78947.1 hypothetical protein ATN84_04105 [Paramesorhizobium deserti]